MGLFSGKVMKLLISRLKDKQSKGWAWGCCWIIWVAGGCLGLFFNFSSLETKIGIQLMVKFSFADL